MKKHVLFTGALAFGLMGISEAQISIGQYGMVSGGNEVTISTDTIAPAGLKITESGPAQTWDYSNFQADVDNDLYFKPAQWTPYAANFPNATTAEVLGSDQYLYYQQDADGMNILGVTQDADGDGNVDMIRFVDELEALKFILEYGDQHQDTGLIRLVIPGDGIQFDSAVYTQLIDYSYVVDAYGMMTTPYGSFNSLRLKIEQATVDSLWVYPVLGDPILQDASVSASREYEWYSNDPGSRYLVFEAYVDEQDSIIAGSYLKEAPRVGLEELTKSKITTYPNPAADQLVMEFSSEEAEGSIEIYDLTGRLVHTENVQGNRIQLDVSSFEQGFYTYRFVDEIENVNSMGKFLIQR